MIRMFNGALYKSRWTMLVLLGVAFLGSPFVNQVYASEITFTFSGEISSITNDVGATSTFGTGTFKTGDTVSASFSFDPTASPTYNQNHEAIYDAVITSYNATTSGGYSASATTGQITMYDNYGSPEYDRIRAGMFQESPYTLTGAPVDNLLLLDFVVSLQDPNQTAFNGIGLPSTLDLSKFDLNARYSAMQFVFANSKTDGDSFRLVTAQITSVSVPEPTTLLLLAFGLIGVAGARKRFER